MASLLFNQTLPKSLSSNLHTYNMLVTRMKRGQENDELKCLFFWVLCNED